MSQPLLLTDEQMRHFIAHGYLLLQTDFSPEFHAAMSRNIREVMTKEGNPGNNILPRVPEVQAVFKHPVIQGALTSVLGPDYIMHPHRHCHFTEPGRKVQSWHKDSYWGHAKVRNHHQWWAMIFYYDHAVDEELGPSSLMPGTQYYNNRTGDESEQDVHLLGEGGAFALIHYDLWHRGTANLSADRTRSMLKFQFVRMARPTAPTWAHADQPWRPMNGDGPPNHHETIWQHQWQWLGGQAGAKGVPGSVGRFVDQLTSADKWARLHAADALGQLGIAAGDAIPALAGALADDYEPVALNAAYALARMGAPAADALLTTLEQGDKDAKRNAGYGLSALGAPGVPGLIDRLAHSDEQTRGYAAFALGEIGLSGNAVAQAAVDGLSKLATDESEWVRRTMVEALGTLDVADQPAVQEAAVTTLAQSLQDADGQVRFTSALSLTRLGPVAAAAVPALQSALHDENRYVRANAVDALNRIGTPDAQRVLIDYLLGSRWCPSTTPESTF
jgi:HEAT repeat protein